MKIPFLKMHGAANDFVVIDHRRPFLEDEPGALVRRLCDRRRGVGADGVLLVESDAELDFAMRYWNADGRPAEFCGNGARCVARMALDLGLGQDGRVRFRTDAGVMEARRGPHGSGIELLFGRVEPPESPRELAALRHHAEFEPAGANVDFVARLGPGRVAMRTYERGVEDETMACGSGAMAAALCAVAEGERAPVAVMTAGGDVLQVGLEAADGAQRVTLIGPAEVAFQGVW